MIHHTHTSGDHRLTDQFVVVLYYVWAVVVIHTQKYMVIMLPLLDVSLSNTHTAIFAGAARR